MAKPVTPSDSRKNLAIVHTLIEELPKDQAAVVGMNALGQLADVMPHEEFVQWIDGALHHATTGQVPTEETQQPTAEGGGATPSTSPSPTPSESGAP